MTKHTSEHAAAARMIRRELKGHGIPASVTSRSFAGGTAVDVVIYDQLPATVAKIEAFVAEFQYGRFDGMTDCYDYTNRREDLPQVKYAHVHVRYSDEIRQAAEAEAERLQLPDAWLVLSGRIGNFWTSRKPRISA